MDTGSFPHFIEEATEAQDSTSFPKLTQLRNHKAWLWTQFCLALTPGTITDICLRRLFLQMCWILCWNWEGLLSSSFFLFDVMVTSGQCQGMLRGKGKTLGSKRGLLAPCSLWRASFCDQLIVLKPSYWSPLPNLLICFLPRHTGLPNSASVWYSTGALRVLKASKTVSILLAEFWHMIALKFSPVSLSRRQWQTVYSKAFDFLWNCKHLGWLISQRLLSLSLSFGWRCFEVLLFVLTLFWGEKRDWFSSSFLGERTSYILFGWPDCNPWQEEIAATPEQVQKCLNWGKGKEGAM